MRDTSSNSGSPVGLLPWKATGTTYSYKTQLEELGFTVECLTAEYSGGRFHKGLGFYEGIRKAFFDRLRHLLDLMRYC